MAAFGQMRTLAIEAGYAKHMSDQPVEHHTMTDKIISIAKIRWLFAETLVIVLGVLIALGLDEYRTDRYEQGLAIDYIQRIQGDVAQDIQYLSTSWTPRLKIKHQSLDAVAPVIRGMAPIPEDLDEFFRNVARAGMLGASVTDWVTDTTFQDLRSTGNLRLIRSSEIRAAITSYYAALRNQLARVESRHTDYVAFVHSIVPAEFRDNMDLDSVRNFGVDFALKRIMSNDYRIVFNQEYNTMLFMEDRPFLEFSKSFLEKLESYQIELEQTRIY
jgi:hypothetical protein